MTVKAIATLKTDIQTVINDNTSNDITPAEVRTSFIDSIDSLDASHKSYDTIADLLLETLTNSPSIKYAWVNGSQGGLFKLISGAPRDGVVNFAAFAAITGVNTSTDTLTVSGAAPGNDTEILLYVRKEAQNTPNLPGGLSEAVKYYVVQSSGSDFKVSTSLGGAAVNITSTGNGTLYYSAYNIVWKRIGIDLTYVTPEMAGAVGDGSTDDAPAFDLAADYCRRYGVGLRSHSSASVYKCNTAIDLRQIDKIELHGRLRTGLTAATFCKVGGVSKHASFTASGTVMSATAHPFTNGDRVTLLTTNTLPAGLGSGVYYIVNANTNDFGLATTVGGSAVNTTNGGTGTHYCCRYDIRAYCNIDLNVQRLISGNYGFNDADGHGIQVTNVQKSQLRFAASGFRTGVRFVSEYFSGAISYNTISFGEMVWNYVNVCYRAERRSNVGATDGWITQCVHHGGNFSGGTSTDGNNTVPRCQILAECDGYWGISEHTFYGPSFEGAIPVVWENDCTAAAVGGNANNMIHDARLECGTNMDISVFKTTTGGGDTVSRTNAVTFNFMTIALQTGYSYTIDSRIDQYGFDRVEVNVVGRTSKQRSQFHCDLGGAYVTGGNIIFPRAPEMFDFANGVYSTGSNPAGTIGITSSAYSNSVASDYAIKHSSHLAPAIRVRKTAGLSDKALFFKLDRIRDMNVMAFGARQLYTADSGTDTMTCNGHGYENNDKVQIYTQTTTPAGISENAVYFIVNKATNTFQLALTAGGAAINITTNGTGNQYVAKMISETDVVGRKGKVYNTMSYAFSGDWLWCSKAVQEVIIGEVHWLGNIDDGSSWVLEETTVHLLARLNMRYHMRLPTSNPSVTGALWNNSGVVTVS